MATPASPLIALDPDGQLVSLSVNASGELIVSGAIGGGSGSGATKITNGSIDATLTDIFGKISLDVNVTDITITHADDSIRLGNGTNFISSETIGSEVALKAEPVIKTVLVDDFSSTETFVGYAAVGTLPNQSLWRIKKITTSGSQTVMHWCDGDSSFNNKWDDRAILTYS